MGLIINLGDCFLLFFKEEFKILYVEVVETEFAGMGIFNVRLHWLHCEWRFGSDLRVSIRTSIRGEFTLMETATVVIVVTNCC